MGGSPIGWIVFAVLVVGMLAIDFAVLDRRGREHAVSLKEAAIWSAVWITLSLLFGAGVWWTQGSQSGLEFLTAWLLEKSLSVDNLFVFLLLFTSFGVAQEHRHRVLFWGVLGALGFRMIFIFAGAALLARFHWMTFVFGGILVLTALKLLVRGEETESDPSDGRVVRVFRRFVPIAEGDHGGRFVVRTETGLAATTLLLVLVVIETSDILFAFDSIPAVFGVTTSPFLVYTSNIFAILGLRALYFLLAGVLEKIEGLDVGLALVLAFIGGKMLASPWMHVPIGFSLAVIALLLATPPFVLFLRRHGVRRAVVLLAGFAVVAVGIAMIVLPGPAILVIPAGLAILGTEFAWARRILAVSREQIAALRRRRSTGGSD